MEKHAVRFLYVDKALAALRSLPVRSELLMVQHMREAEQYFFPNTHEPIVSQELWDKAQKNIKIISARPDYREAKLSAIFLGSLYCVDCGNPLNTNIYS